MNKLTINHLAPYLPYKLKARCCVSDYQNFEIDAEIVGLYKTYAEVQCFESDLLILRWNETKRMSIYRAQHPLKDYE